MSFLRSKGGRFGLTAAPNCRFSHTKAVPRVGGLSVFLPFIILGFVSKIRDNSFIGFAYVSSTGNYIDTLYGFFGVFDLPYWFGRLISGVTIAFIINAVKLSDGIDRLSAGTTLISLIVFTILANSSKHLFILIFIGIRLMLFLRFNLSGNRKVILGDSGSLGHIFV